MGCGKRQSADFSLAHVWGSPQVSFSPDSRILFAQAFQETDDSGDSTHPDENSKLWDVWTGKELLNLHGNTPIPIYFHFSPDGHFLATMGYEDCNHIWDLQTLREVGRIEGHIEAWATMGDITLLGTFVEKDKGKPNSIVLWRLASGQSPQKERTIPVSVDCFNLSPDGKVMVTACKPEKDDSPTEIVLWDTILEKPRLSFFYKESLYPYNLSFLANGNLLCVVSSSSPLHEKMHFGHPSFITSLWDLTPNPREIGRFDIPSIISSDCRWLVDSPCLAFDDAEINLHKLPNLEKTGNLGHVKIKYGHGFRLNEPDIDFSPEGGYVLIVTKTMNDRTNQKSNWLTGWLNHFLATPSSGVPVASLWDTETVKKQMSFANCKKAIFSPDGKTLATLYKDKFVKLWELPLRKPLGLVCCLSFVFWFLALGGWHLGGRFFVKRQKQGHKAKGRKNSPCG